MSQLIDQIAERHIAAAQRDGQFDQLAGAGAPLVLEDDSLVPEALRAGYRLLKNAGYIPPELEQRRELLQLCDLLGQCASDSPQQQALLRRLRQLELRLRIKGIDTAFIQHYLQSLAGRSPE